MVDLCFDDLHELYTSKQCEKIRKHEIWVMVHELWSRNMAINGGSTQKYEEIGP